jgi:hypothetical protein
MCRWARKAIAVVMLEGAANRSLLPGGFYGVGARTKGDCCAFKRRHRFYLWEIHRAVGLG